MAVVETGAYLRDKVALACLKAYVDASDTELRDLNITREDCLRLAREYIGSGYSDTELSTIFERVAVAYRLGQMTNASS